MLVALDTKQSYINITEHIESPLVNDDVLLSFKVVNYVVLGQFFAVFGCVTNIINMVVFARIGFRDSTNVSLFALAVSDFGACFTAIFWNLGMTPWFGELDLPFHSMNIMYMLAGWPHVMFTKITTVTTAFVTFERCLCVTMPLKVKSIVTRKRVKIFLATTYILVAASYAPMYFANRIAFKFDLTRNKTILDLAFPDNKKEIEEAVLRLHNILFSLSGLILIVVCTAILVVSLVRKANWRQSITASDTGEVSNKERRVANMVTFISTLFIVCFTPGLVLQLMMTVNHNISINGTQVHLLEAFCSCATVLESINAAMNIFIYYNNSSVYKAKIRKLARIQTDEVSESKTVSSTI